MGRLTRGQIVSEALLLAGNTQLTARANVWLNYWLDARYAAWPWPFLLKRTADIQLAAGTNILLVGNAAIAGAGYLINDTIKEIKDPITLYNSTRSQKGQVRIRESTGAPPGIDESSADPTQQGQPLYCKAVQDQTGKPFGTWQLTFWPTPNQTVLIALDYYYIPPQIDTSTAGDTVTPLYPSDRTMIQAVIVEALRWQDRQDKLPQEQAALESYSQFDIQKFGEVVGTGDIMGLDTRLFRPGGTYNGT